MTANIDVSLLGYPQVKYLDELVTFPSHKVMALFSYLVVCQQACSRDKLVGLLWGDVSETKAKTSLRSALYSIQQQLPDVLEVTRKQVALSQHANLTVDVWQFEAYIRQPSKQHAAIHLYQAEFLDGFYIPGAPDFDHWLLVQREKLHQCAVDYLEKAIKRDDNESLEAAQKLSLLEPWREEAYRYLMRSYARRGEYTRALMAYQRLQGYIDQELQVEPSAETKELAVRIEHLRDHPHHNLPSHLIPLVGRDKDFSFLKAHIEEARTVTIQGMGGIGKTHLALHLAMNLHQAFMDGAWFIPLIDINTSEDLPQLVAQTLKIPLANQQDATDQILSHLRTRESLLVFDNFEHLLADDRSVNFLNDLLAQCPAIKLIITSRERLHFAGEYVYLLKGLSTEHEQHSPAVDLFLAVAQRQDSHFSLKDGELQLVREFCEHVEGLPLAIEIAASTMHWQTVRRLQDSLTTLASNQVGMPERHRNLDALMAYSWSLLTEVEQYALINLPTIRGRFTHDAAYKIAQINSAVLIALIEKSLVMQHEDEYSLHEVVRQYAKQRQSSKSEIESRERHRQYYFDLFASALCDLQNSNFSIAMQQLTSQLGNFVDAWEWAIEQQQTDAFSGKLLQALQYLLADRGYNSLFLRLAQQAVDLFSLSEDQSHFEQRAHAILLYLYGLNWYTNDFDRFRQIIDTLEKDLRQQQASYLLALCLRLKGWHAQYHCKAYQAAEAAFSEAYERFIEDANEHEATRILNDLGLVVQDTQPELARERWQDALALASDLDDVRLEAALLCNLAELDLKEGDHIFAEMRFSRALEIQSNHYGVLLSAYMGLADIYLHVDKLEDALHMAQLALDAAKVRHQHGDLVNGYMMMARVFFKMGRKQAARQQLQQALHIADVEKDTKALEDIKALLTFGEAT